MEQEEVEITGTVTVPGEGEEILLAFNAKLEEMRLKGWKLVGLGGFKLTSELIEGAGVGSLLSTKITATLTMLFEREER